MTTGETSQTMNAKEGTEIIGKSKEVKSKSRFYPVTYRGSYIKTFHKLVQEELEAIAKPEIHHKKC